MISFVFFFSSRRRHTRSKRDWSSDVCSSDLKGNCSRISKRHRKIQSNKNNFVPNPIKTHVVCQFLYLLISLTDLVRKHLEFLAMADNLPHCQFLYLL